MADSKRWKWPLLRQLAKGDWKGLNGTAFSARTESLTPRVRTSEKVVKSICPYCAVGCGQLVYVNSDKQVTSIEGDPDSPISGGTLCPKGASSFQLVTGTQRVSQVLHRRPGSRQWEVLPLDKAMDMVAERVTAARDATWEEKDEEGNVVNRTLGIAHLGGATLDNEENYLIKKLFTALGVVQVENQARI